jgi:hypothetical protein
MDNEPPGHALANADIRMPLSRLTARAKFNFFSGVTAARWSTPGRVNAGSVPRGKLRIMVGSMLGLTEVGAASCGNYSGRLA